jgi:hypothetical protein
MWHRRRFVSLALTASVVCACRERPTSVATQAAAAPAEQPALEETKTDWKPAEFRGEQTRWRDCGVYVDGEPVGFLGYGELPRALSPVWEEVEIKLPFGPGEIAKSETRRLPRFRLVDYLEAVGVDLDKVREVQLIGGQNYAIRLTREALRKYRDGLRFRFGRDVSGKVLPIFPRGMELNTTFDKLRAVTIYIDKEPPEISSADTLVLGGEPLHDIAYFGEPLRGGIHIYKDGRLALFLKRRELAQYTADADTGSPGAVRATLFGILEAHGVATQDIREGELIHREKRAATYERNQLASALFVANPRARGQILLGPEKTPTKALMLYTARKRSQ